MVNVAQKDVTVRSATASAVVTMRSDVLAKLISGTSKKGDALTTAKIAGIAAAKRTGQLIPLCHTLPLDWVDITLTPDGDNQLRIVATAETTARTGVEMEALTAASVAALTLYDMAKSGDKGITIGPIQLERKSGGASGTYVRTP